MHLCSKAMISALAPPAAYAGADTAHARAIAPTSPNTHPDFPTRLSPPDFPFSYAPDLRRGIKQIGADAGKSAAPASLVQSAATAQQFARRRAGLPAMVDDHLTVDHHRRVSL